MTTSKHQLQTHPQLALDFSGATPTATALGLDDALPWDRFLALGRTIRSCADASSWWVGDWLVATKGRFPKRYADARGLWPERSYEGLKSLAAVCRAVPAHVRRADLEYSHHQVVAKLPEAEQRVWLARAAAAGMTRDELRLAVSDAKAGRVTVAETSSDATPEDGSVEVLNASPVTAEESATTTPSTADEEALEMAPPLLNLGYVTLMHDALRAAQKLTRRFAKEEKARGPLERWPAEERQALEVDLEPLINEFDDVIRVYERLTAAGKLAA